MMHGPAHVSPINVEAKLRLASIAVHVIAGDPRITNRTALAPFSATRTATPSPFGACECKTRNRAKRLL